MSLDLADCSDGDLAALGSAGRQAAYSELMRRHRDTIYRIIRGNIADADQALDVTQQTFIAAFAALDRYDRARPFRLWLIRIALNKCHDWARRRAVRRFFVFALPIEDARSVADPAIGADVALSDRQDLRRAMDAMAKLPSNLRETLTLRTIEGLSQSETALALGVSEKAVETRLYRARAKLVELLRD